MNPSSSFRILLVICGGIAAYKSLLLIRLLKKIGISVRCVMTRSASEFVTPLSVASLSGDSVYTELFSLTDEAEMGHIELSRQANIVIVAPATANMMAKMVHGIADDLASTILMATDKPVLVVPSMNVRMFEHAATQRNIQQLRADGVFLLGPVQGDMACGEFGYGRMVEPESIVNWVENYRLQKKPIILILGAIPQKNEDNRFSIPPIGEDRFSEVWTALCSFGLCIDLWVGVYPESIRLPHTCIQNEEELIELQKENASALIFSLGTWLGEVPSGIHDLYQIDDWKTFLQSKIIERL